VPDTADYFVRVFTIDKTFEWSLNGDGARIVQTRHDGEYTGTLDVQAVRSSITAPSLCRVEANRPANLEVSKPKLCPTRKAVILNLIQNLHGLYRPFKGDSGSGSGMTHNLGYQTETDRQARACRSVLVCTLCASYRGVASTKG